MKTRRMFLIALCGVAMLIGTSSCKKEKQENENGEKMVIKASLGSAGNNSKTHLEGPSVIWDPADAFKLFPTDGTAGAEFTLTRIDEQDGKVAYFEGSHPGGEHFYACYPFSNVSCNTPGTFEFEIPESQSDVTNAGPMVGYMENPSGTLAFQNAMSWLKVGLKGNAIIKRVVLTDRNNKPLNGTLTVTCSNEGEFSFETSMSGSGATANQLEIVLNEALELKDDYTYFWFQVPAGSLEELNLSVYASDASNAQAVLSLDKTIADGVAMNKIYTAEVSSSLAPTVGPTVDTKTGCSSNTAIYGFSANVTGKDEKCTTYKVFVCYNLSSADDPTMERCEGCQEIGTFTIAKNQTQEISYDIIGLTVGQTYKVRAYATNGIGNYGAVKEITVGAGPKPMGWESYLSPMTFSVGEGKSVRFSQGNLQYIGSAETPYWKFADHQFDIFGKGNEQNGSAASNVNRDLFGWGSTGNKPSNDPQYVCYQPWATSNDNTAHYGPSINRPEDERNLLVSNGSDWGYNAISNGGNAVNSGWRVLTKTEWEYLLGREKEGKRLFGIGKVGGCTPGLIVLPDGWDFSSGHQFTPGLPGQADFNNNYDYDEWAVMENEGAVFLPFAGKRNGTEVGNPDWGYYWTSTYDRNSDRANCLFIRNVDINGGPASVVSNPRNGGFSVRLVKDAN